MSPSNNKLAALREAQGKRLVLHHDNNRKTLAPDCQGIDSLPGPVLESDRILFLSSGRNSVVECLLPKQQVLAGCPPDPFWKTIMIQKTDATRVAEDLREILSAALSDGVGRGEIVSMIATIIADSDVDESELSELAEERWDHPIYEEVPPGLIDLKTAAEKYGRPLQQLQHWVQRGYLQSYGRIKARARGGGYHLVKEKTLIEQMAKPPNKGGRPKKLG